MFEISNSRDGDGHGHAGSGCAGKALMRVVPALDRGLEILEFLGSVDGPVRPAEIIARLGLPRTAVYELIHTLRERGFVEPVGEGHLWLGAQLFSLGSKYAGKLDVARVGQEIAAFVTQQVEETVQVGVLRGRNVLYIARSDPDRIVRLVSAVGRQLPAHCTALGKVLLSELTTAELEARLGNGELEALTARSITDPAVLRTELATILQTGVAYDDRESNLEVNCIAAPVRNVVGDCVAAISISVPLARMTPDRTEIIRDAVLAGAQRISSRLGYSPVAGTAG
ncbi:IclR family transcriptional regulator [Nakamurella antarctica]|uniref:IclR family transcriptional regulator n=1 Tax=Nakamurella antarctica TaxID=1902245 RepID=A0A3G8ZKP8_9ACTN|nr:IclR family transcriptional regulator [Nakamurella antarctica]AZI57415.1 IclR family transcriptional regulator [Nakamurella antarctica]